MSRRPTRRPAPAIIVLLLLLALVAAACASSGAGTPGGQPPASETPGGSEPPGEAPSEEAAPIAVDFAPGGATVTLDNGWTIGRCEGEAPLLCVSDGDRHLGSIEYGSYPSSDDLAAAMADGRLLEWLEARAAEQHESIAADRAVGCGPDYEYLPAPVTRTTVGGEPAVVYAFTGVVDGREIERFRAYYTVHGGQVWIVSAPASDPDGCMATDLGEFAPGDLVTFEPYLDRIVVGSELPAGGWAIADGMVAAVDGGLDGGLLYLVWQGGKQRIQQPAAMTDADVEAKGLTRESAVAVLTVVDEAAGSYFAVVPPDGPEARLQLVVDGLIREVIVQHVAPEALDGVGDIDGLVLDRVRPAASAAG